MNINNLNIDIINSIFKKINVMDNQITKILIDNTGSTGHTGSNFLTNSGECPPNNWISIPINNTVYPAINQIGYTGIHNIISSLPFPLTNPTYNSENFYTFGLPSGTWLLNISLYFVNNSSINISRFDMIILNDLNLLNLTGLNNSTKNQNIIFNITTIFQTTSPTVPLIMSLNLETILVNDEAVYITLNEGYSTINYTRIA